MTTRKRILLAEDDPETAMLLRRILETTYDVKVVHDGVEALWELQNDPTPDLLVTDLMMPECDGITLIREMKAHPRTKRIPVIIITAKASASDVIEGINVGARHYITKPFKGMEVLGKVKKLLGGP